MYSIVIGESLNKVLVLYSYTQECSVYMYAPQNIICYRWNTGGIVSTTPEAGTVHNRHVQYTVYASTGGNGFYGFLPYLFFFTVLCFWYIATHSRLFSAPNSGVILDRD